MLIEIGIISLCSLAISLVFWYPDRSKGEGYMPITPEQRYRADIRDAVWRNPEVVLSLIAEQRYPLSASFLKEVRERIDAEIKDLEKRHLGMRQLEKSLAQA